MGGTKMITLNWDEVSDIRHALRKAKFRLSHHGFDKDACMVHDEVEKLNLLVLNHEDDSDD